MFHVIAKTPTCKVDNCVVVFIVSYPSHFYHGTLFLFKRKADKLWLFSVVYCGRYFLECMEWACHIKENNWQFAVPVIKINLPSINQIFLVGSWDQNIWDLLAQGLYNITICNPALVHPCFRMQLYDHDKWGE